MLEAWGYSASGRGRKKAGDAEQGGAPARERLEHTLKDIFGRDRSPIKSLYPKLAGTTHATVRDAARLHGVGEAGGDVFPGDLFIFRDLVRVVRAKRRSEARRVRKLDLKALRV
mgnify:CR=1 FL=1